MSAIDATTERRARALCKSYGLDPDAISSLPNFRVWEIYLDHARAIAESDKERELKLVGPELNEKQVTAMFDAILRAGFSDETLRAGFRAAWNAAPWLPEKETEL